jgi:hypothetical protein
MVLSRVLRRLAQQLMNGTPIASAFDETGVGGVSVCSIKLKLKRLMLEFDCK